MKKVMAFVLIGMFVLSLGLVSAKTMISGVIYNADYTEKIANASVTVTCDHNGDIGVQNTESLADGIYGVIFNETGSNSCNNGDILTVYAEKGSLTGIQSGEIRENFMGDWDVGIVNVPLVPEFGFYMGMLTILSAVGIFFVVRKE